MSAVITLTSRYMRKTLAHPEEIIGMLIQPILWVALFGVGMKSLMGDSIAGLGDGYMTFMLPGVVALTALGGAIGGGTGWLIERTQGLVKEYLVAPIPRISILVANAGNIVIKVLIQVLVIIAIGLLFGARLGLDPLGWIVGLLFISGYAFGFSGIALATATKTDSAEAYHMMIFMLNLPLLFLSNALYPMESLPSWMQVGAYLNPTTYVVSGMRSFMMAPSEMGAADPIATWLSVLVTIGFACFGILLALRAFKSTIR
jgi:ABC-2 type transport system permease protein